MHYKTDLLDLRHMDNMELMATFPDKHFALAIVDPPYGIGVNSMRMGSRKTVAPDARQWDDKIPDATYFDGIKRVSRNQVIWGGNYFALPPSRAWALWDKGETMYGRDFAEAEMAWVSIDTVVRVFKYPPNQLDRIHPTQKPVALYKWLLANYAKPGDNILDTHLGSGSIAIACHYAGHHLTACELDEDYFAASIERIKRETAQQELPIFTPPQPEQIELL